MKIKNLNIVSRAVLAIVSAFVFVLPVSAQAATTPSLGAAASYGVLSSTFTNTAETTINGDVGYTTPPAVAPTVSGATHVADSSYSQAGTDQNSALEALNAQSCNFNFGSATDLSLLPQPLAPGVYCVSGAVSIGTGGITLNSSGTYIFRISGALTTVANSSVTGGNACNVFWTPIQATTLGANSSFLGTNIDAAGITVGSTVNWSGRALAFGGTVTTNADTITAPSCGTPVETPTPAPVTPTPTPEEPAPTPTPAPVTTPTPTTSTSTATTPSPVIAPPAIVPVVVPTLPRTGFPPAEKNNLWNTIIQKLSSLFF